ncbi:alpha-L-fucosidase [Haloferula sp. A504]|uniref:alpha-L-fucosidase n=1 Tax=Haloferula sp. A504 TaxID=3373601 RepID=UPI0031C6710C|nr:alpha-L-fucosidase [Verrucomicrobiaceae bacterium E54]
MQTETIKRLLLLAFAGQFAAAAAEPMKPSPDPYVHETSAQHDQRMAWWREAKFGMFIHWGIYAVPAGTYEGKRIDGIGEWIMHAAKIPVAEYKAFAPQFTAADYDPEAWAALARKAGMRYIVITSKHHDGFALFDSAASEWDAVDAAGAKRDLIAPLAAAARTQGLKFGLYYSQAQDWTHPGGAKAGYQEGEYWDEAQDGNFDDYLRTVAKPQVKEILTKYQPDILWWDTPSWMNKERAELLIPHLGLVPGIIHNNRLGGGYKGDTETPEQHIPATGIKGRDWEVCMTMNDTWGFKSYDHNWKSVETLIRQLCDIVSKGGNFLLNVGPTAKGEIPRPSIERLEAVGRWMEVNGEAIYGTSASPFHRLPWGRCTRKEGDAGTTLYLHVFDWPQDGKLRVPGLNSRVAAASLLAGGAKLETTRDDTGVVVTLPPSAPEAIASVIKLETAGALDVEPIALRQQPDGRVVLEVEFAELHNPGYGTHIQLDSHDGQRHLGHWTDKRAWLEWTFKVNTPGSFTVTADVACPEESAVETGVDGQLKRAAIAATGGYESFKSAELGRVSIDTAGTHRFCIKPVADDWKPVNLRTVTLKPAE